MSKAEIIDLHPATANNNMPESLWVATAGENTVSYPAVCDELDVEILIVGAGFTGLSAALHLGEQGHSVAVLDAVQPGFGASGRNGGQIIPGLKLYPDAVLRHFGKERGNNIVRATNDSADLVHALIKRHQINCHVSQAGFIQPAYSKSALKVIESRVDQLVRYGAPVELLNKATTRDHLGSDTYCGALLDRRGGALHPLRYAQGLAQAAVKTGVQIFGHSPVSTIEKAGDGWLATSLGKSIRAKQVLLCTNGYSDMAGENGLWPGLDKSIIPLYSFQVATKPLSPALRKVILPQGHVVADTRRLLTYFRLDHEGRLVVGGRGGVEDATELELYQHIIERLKELYPQLGEPEIEYFWSGKVALTLDGLPHIHRLGSGLHAGLGFNGRGVGMATLMGQWLAQLAGEQALPAGSLPVTELKPIRFLQWRKPVMKAAVGWKGVQDQMERLVG